MTSESAAPKFEALSAPPPTLEHGGYELVRAAIARHIGRIYAREASMGEDQVIEKVCATFEAEMARPTNIGATNSIG
jgi:hypothetical protein